MKILFPVIILAIFWEPLLQAFPGQGFSELLEEKIFGETLELPCDSDSLLEREHQEVDTTKVSQQVNTSSSQEKSTTSSSSNSLSKYQPAFTRDFVLFSIPENIPEHLLVYWRSFKKQLIEAIKKDWGKKKFVFTLYRYSKIGAALDYYTEGYKTRVTLLKDPFFKEYHFGAERDYWVQAIKKMFQKKGGQSFLYRKLAEQWHNLYIDLQETPIYLHQIEGTSLGYTFKLVKTIERKIAWTQKIEDEDPCSATARPLQRYIALIEDAAILYERAAKCCNRVVQNGGDQHYDSAKIAEYMLLFLKATERTFDWKKKLAAENPKSEVAPLLQQGIQELDQVATLYDRAFKLYQNRRSLKSGGKTWTDLANSAQDILQLIDIIELTINWKKKLAAKDHDSTTANLIEQIIHCSHIATIFCEMKSKGWNSRLFVRADRLPYIIRDILASMKTIELKIACEKKIAAGTPNQDYSLLLQRALEEANNIFILRSQSMAQYKEAAQFINASHPSLAYDLLTKTIDNASALSMAVLPHESSQQLTKLKLQSLEVVKLINTLNKIKSTEALNPEETLLLEQALVKADLAASFYRQAAEFLSADGTQEGNRLHHSQLREAATSLFNSVEAMNLKLTLQKQQILTPEISDYIDRAIFLYDEDAQSALLLHASAYPQRNFFGSLRSIADKNFQLAKELSEASDAESEQTFTKFDDEGTDDE